MTWTADFAYAVGLITTDGNLSKDGRHIDFTSKDREQILNFKKIIKPDVRISTKKSSNGTIYPRIQFSDVKLYRFLISIGLHPNKSKTIKQILVPNKFFADFLRGCFDGDGCTYSYWDKRWKSSFLLYMSITSSSMDFLKWIQKKVSDLYQITGRIKGGGKSAYQLVYAKRGTLMLISKIYHSDTVVCLKRKRFKIEKALGIINKQAGVEKLEYSLP